MVKLVEKKNEDQKHAHLVKELTQLSNDVRTLKPLVSDTNDRLKKHLEDEFKMD
jgi:uncharacterized protein YlxW (UPF0749 family)